MRNGREADAPEADRGAAIRLATARAPMPAARTLGLRTRAIWIAAAYALVSGLWIWFSDQILASIVVDESAFLFWSSWKGLGFVAATTMLLFVMLWRAFVAVENGFDDLQDAERRLRRGESQLTAVIGSAMDAIVAVDAAGHVALFNEAAVRMFGRAESDALGLPLEQLVQDLGPDASGERLVREGLRADGERFPIEASVSRVTTDDHGLVILVLRDISVRLAKQREIERLGRLYAALSRIDQAIMRTSDRTALFERVCSVLVEDGGLQMAWVGVVDPETGAVDAAVSPGSASPPIRTPRAGARPAGRCARTGRSSATTCWQIRTWLRGGTPPGPIASWRWRCSPFTAMTS